MAETFQPSEVAMMQPMTQRTVCRAGLIAGLIALGLAVLAPLAVRACPFCAATSQTLSEEMAAADVVVLAKLAKAPQSPAKAKESDQPGSARSETKFEIVNVMKGDQHLAGAKSLKVLYFGEDKDLHFLITGMALPNLQWSTPIPLEEDAKKYVEQLPSLPEKGAERLAFFQRYFEHEDPMLAQDAYDEFARAPYSDVIELKDQMQHDALIAWIGNNDISPSHRRLYLTMLGVCGSDQDLPLLEKMMRSGDRRSKAGLDAMIACYLTLKGAEGMPLVEELFLENKEAEYADTYAAIMALRFHGQETDVVPRERLLEGLRHMLDRPDLADLVISDLARWNDWSVMDRLVNLFKTADDASSWVRVPVINYLQAASRQAEEPATRTKAAAAMDELAKIDPAAVKQAKSFAAFGALAGGGKPQAGTKKDAPDKQPDAIQDAQAGGSSAADGAPPEPRDEPAEAAEVEPDPSAEAGDRTVNETTESPTAAESAGGSVETSDAKSEDARLAAPKPQPNQAAVRLPASEPRTSEESQIHVNSSGYGRLGILLVVGVVMLVVLRLVAGGSAR